MLPQPVRCCGFSPHCAARHPARCCLCFPCSLSSAVFCLLPTLDFVTPLLLWIWGFLPSSSTPPSVPVGVGHMFPLFSGKSHSASLLPHPAPTAVVCPVPSANCVLLGSQEFSFPAWPSGSHVICAFPLQALAPSFYKPQKCSGFHPHMDLVCIPAWPRALKSLGDGGCGAVTPALSAVSWGPHTVVLERARLCPVWGGGVWSPR